MHGKPSPSFTTAAYTVAPRDALLIVFVVIGLVVIRDIHFVSDWHMTHWAFTYEHGFIKRGLIGETISRLFGPVTSTIINSVSWGIMLSLSAALIYLFLRPAWESKRIGVLLFAVVALTHSATIPHLVHDIGRFDHINLLILLGCMFILSRPSQLLRLTVIPLLCLIGLLIHEVFFLMFLPLIFAVWFYEERREWIWPKLLMLVALIASTWAIGTYGLITDFPIERYMAQLRERHTFSIPKDSVDVLYRGFAGNIMFNIEEFYKYLRPNVTHHIVFALTLIPTISFFGKLIHRLCLEAPTCERLWRVLLVTAALGPLALYVLATDYFRWWSIAITNLFIVFAYLVVRENDTSRLADAVESSQMVVACILGISLVFGPIGVMINSYPLINLWFLPSWHFSW